MVKCPVADKAEMDYRWSLWPSLNTLKDSEEEYQKRNSEEEYRFRILYISLVLYVQTALRADLFMEPSHKTPGQGAAGWWGWETRCTLLGQRTQTQDLIPTSPGRTLHSAASWSLLWIPPALPYHFLPFFFFLLYSLFTRLKFPRLNPLISHSLKRTHFPH